MVDPIVRNTILAHQITYPILFLFVNNLTFCFCWIIKKFKFNFEKMKFEKDEGKEKTK